MSQLKCCVPGCDVISGLGIPLHRFPNPNKKNTLFMNWIKCVGGDLSTLDANYVFKNRRVCSRHFDSVYIYPPSNRLCSLAVPALFLPTEELNTEAVLEVPVQVVRKEATTRTTGVYPEELNTEAVLEVPVQIVRKEATTRTTGVYRVAKKHCDNKEEFSFRKLVAQLRAKIRLLKRRRNQHLEKKLTHKLKTKEQFNAMLGGLPEGARTFFAMQLSQCGKKIKGRRFTIKEKIFCLALYKRSPKCYRFLSTLCILPKRGTLQKILRKMNLATGIDKKMFEELKKRVKQLPKTNRICTLIFDEMALAPGLGYDKKNDNIVGLTDDGEIKRKELCDHVLVFMVRGIIKKYKQPVSYTFCRGSTKSYNLKKQIKNVVENLQAAGLQVVATVCDQGATNRAAINSLLDETKAQYLKDGKAFSGGFFKINGKKIFALYDPPHLIKGVRNNLLTKNLLFKQDGKTKIAKWSHVEELFQRDPGYDGLKLIPKLTAHHVNPKLIPKMRVKYCTQIFSRTTGVAMGFMADCGKLSGECKDTADLLIFFDEVFDSVNGSYHQVQNGKVYRSAVTPKSPHHGLWKKSIPVLKSMNFFDKAGRKVLVPSISSWIKTIEGIEKLLILLKNMGVNSVLLRNLNQDPLENFFGAIRSHGQFNTMPDAQAFQAAYKTLLVNNLSSPHSVGANCEKDGLQCLQSLKYLINDKLYIECNESILTEINCNHLLMQLNDTQSIIEGTSRTDVERTAAIAYCSGWLVTKVQKSIFKGCPICKADLKSEVVEDFHKNIKFREYENKGWLCYPTRQIFDYFASIETIVNKVLSDDCQRNDIAQYLKLIVQTNLNLNFLSCGEHKEKNIDFIINKSIQFFIYTWCKTVNKIVEGKISHFDQDDIKKSAYEYYKKNKNRKKYIAFYLILGIIKL